MSKASGRKALIPLLLAVGVVALLWLFRIPCPVKALFDVPCPTCGVTRALVCLLRGDLSGYMTCQPLALPLAFAVVLCFFLPVVQKKALRIAGYAVEGLVLAANTVLYVLRLING